MVEIHLLLYLADHLGGGPAIRNLVQDSSTGAAGIEDLARNPIDATPGVIGRNFIDIWTNFTIAATLDSDQGVYGMSTYSYPLLVVLASSVGYNQQTSTVIG